MGPFSVYNIDNIEEAVGGAMEEMEATATPGS
jgi:hypothetical protein